MKKRIFTILLASTMLLLQLLVGANAAEVAASGDCGADSSSVSWVLNSDGLLTIRGTGAMADCSSNAPWSDYRDSIQAVTVAEGVTNISAAAFAFCDNLASVTIGSSVTHIAEGAFEGCVSLTGMTIPDSVISIDAYVFTDCYNLTGVTMGNHVRSIGEGAFEGSGLTSVTIPGSVTSIGKDAFLVCNDLAEIMVDESNTSYSSKDGVLFNKAKTMLLCYPGGKSGAYTIPNGVTVVGDAAFSSCKLLTDVTIPKSVTTIGQRAFASCESLTDVYYGGSETQWGSITIEDENDPLHNAAFHYDAQGEDPIPNPFTDVKETSFYYTPVQWAVENNVTTGMTETSFDPNSPCTRGQVVTFLWRAAGKPEPQSSSNPFTDVPSGKFYSKAVLWAVENGIASGITKTTFEPNSPCTRGQVVTFQWRAAGKPDSESASNSFTDVPAGKFYSKAVLWAVENKITSGMSKTTFAPDNICTRGQIVTFLYRQYS